MSMTPEDYLAIREEYAIRIMAGFAANPAVFAHNDQHGWSLVNATNAQLAGYAVELAGHVMKANAELP